MSVATTKSPSRHHRWLGLLLGLCTIGCGTDVDVTGLPSIVGYESWPNFPVTEPAPAHGDTYRVLYANPVARAYPRSGRYAPGAVLVKEIFEKSDDGTRGKLIYRAIMRKVGAEAAARVPAEDGWLYTDLRDGEESHRSSCAPCHRQAPFDGTWYDYGS